MFTRVFWTAFNLIGGVFSVGVGYAAHNVYNVIPGCVALVLGGMLLSTWFYED
jgi:hypothetical protein